MVNFITKIVDPFSVYIFATIFLWGWHLGESQVTLCDALLCTSARLTIGWQLILLKYYLSANYRPMRCSGVVEQRRSVVHKCGAMM